MNVNLSEYQKLIFVKDINEGDYISYIHPYANTQYPFAVFFTTNNNSNYGYPVHNIWHDGVRLTRFVGVDPSNNIIKVGSHELKLKFDYGTGLLGIIDTNKLQSISLLSISYTEAGTHNNINYNNNDGTIDNVILNSEDNKFKLNVQFVYDNTDGELGETSNVLKITPSLNFNAECSDPNNINTNYFSVIGNPVFKYTASSVGNTTGYPDIAVYEYNCIINYESNDVSKTYNIIPLYDESKTITLDNIKFYLNPTVFTLYKENNIILEGSNIVLETGTYNFKIKIRPTRGEEYSYPVNYDNRPLLLSITSDSNKVRVPEENINITNDEQSFNIVTQTPDPNTIVTATVGLYIKTTSNGQDYTLCSKKINITLNGISNVCYYFAGFLPEGVSDPSGLTDLNTFEYITGKVLWDWTDHYGEANGNEQKDFYIIIPESFNNLINPCCDLYVTDNSLQTENKKYISVLNRFEIVNSSNSSGTWDNIANKHTSMIVYKSKSDFKGLFYGKIQIQ